VAERNGTFASTFIEKLQQAPSDDRILHKLWQYACIPRTNNSGWGKMESHLNVAASLRVEWSDWGERHGRKSREAAVRKMGIDRIQSLNVTSLKRHISLIPTSSAPR
jgi:hypothetical protein